MTLRRSDAPETAGALLEHQQDLIDSVFAPGAKRTTLLRAATGTGRDAVFAGLARRALQGDTKARVLLIVTAFAQDELSHRLQLAGVPALEIDRYRYRELLESSDADSVWPPGAAAVVSLDFALEPDIATSVAAVRWALVVVGDIDLWHTAVAPKVGELCASADRVLFASTGELPKAFLSGEVRTVDWRWEESGSWPGTPPELTTIVVTPSESETRLADTVASFVAFIEKAGLSRYVHSGDLVSGPAALEGAIRQFRQSLQRSNIALPDSESARQALSMTAGILEELERCGADPRATALVQLVEQLKQRDEPVPRVLVIVESVATVYYVGAEMEACGLPVHLLLREMTAGDRKDAMESFASRGGILISTIVMLRSVEIGPVADLVVYNAAMGSKHAMLRVARERTQDGRPLRIHVMLSPKQARRWNTDFLAELGEVAGVAKE